MRSRWPWRLLLTPRPTQRRCQAERRADPRFSPFLTAPTARPWRARHTAREKLPAAPREKRAEDARLRGGGVAPPRRRADAYFLCAVFLARRCSRYFLI